jgi:release factor glutamine methyltransferase
VKLAGASVREARRLVAACFAAAGLDEADLDARVLVRHVAAVDPALPGAGSDRRLDEAEAAALVALAERRLAREPIARILGRREFHGHELMLNPACLVPRPDTEAIVEAALDLLPAGQEARILDLGTGPGTILLALLAARPRARGLGIDRSAEALAAAAGNAEALGLAERAAFAEGDWGRGVEGTFDLVVSNPPYIPSATCDGLEPEVRDFEPRLALDGGADGLAAYRAILADGRRLIAPGGHLVFELGIGQAGEVASLARDHGFAVCGLRSDLAGVPRALLLRPAL